MSTLTPRRQRSAKRSVGFVSALVGCCVVFTPGAASSSPTAGLKVQLRYDVDEPAASCPSEAEFRAEVLRRLPDDPFAPDGSVVILTRIDRRAERLRATVLLREPSPPTEVTEELFASLDDCATLSAAAALVVSLAIERSRSHASFEPRPAAPSREEVPVKTALAPQASRAPVQAPEPKRATLDLRTQVASDIGYGILPGVSAGSSFGLSLKRDVWSAGLEAGAWLPATVESSRGGGATASLRYLSGSVCTHRLQLFVCGAATVGDFHAAGTMQLLSRAARSTYLALGGRLGVELPLWRPLALVLQLEAIAPLVGATLEIGGQLLWETPTVGAHLTAGFRVSIL
ncbi:MAG: hypothetical protein K0S65_59 [Labilithrix sp.]|nr:hypothetical protein [Labilithrix sp.]